MVMPQQQKERLSLARSSDDNRAVIVAGCSKRATRGGRRMGRNCQKHSDETPRTPNTRDGAVSAAKTHTDAEPMNEQRRAKYYAAAAAGTSKAPQLSFFKNVHPQINANFLEWRRAVTTRSSHRQHEESKSWDDAKWITKWKEKNRATPGTHMYLRMKSFADGNQGRLDTDAADIAAHIAAQAARPGSRKGRAVNWATIDRQADKALKAGSAAASSQSRKREPTSTHAAVKKKAKGMATANAVPVPQPLGSYAPVSHEPIESIE
eukprot:SAG22_NODE_1047_length_5859_cov_2.126042_5_plen_264_part_00